MHGRHRGQLAHAQVGVDQLIDVNVGHRIAIGRQEHIAPHVPQGFQDAQACQAVIARLGQHHPAVQRVRARRRDHLQPAGAHVHLQVVRAVVVVDEIVADGVALVAQAQHEAGRPVGPIVLHDVPQDRAAADLDHRLGLELRFLAQARAEPAAQDQGV